MKSGVMGECADPYLILYALHGNYCLLTDELDKARRKNKKNKEKLPDVCNAEGIKWKSLDDFLHDEKII